jgi:hypothetical protein
MNTTEQIIEPDFRIEDHGTIIRFTPVSEEGKAEVEEMGLEGWQFMGESFHIERRVAHDLVRQLHENGFTTDFV